MIQGQSVAHKILIMMFLCERDKYVCMKNSSISKGGFGCDWLSCVYVFVCVHVPCRDLNK